MQCPDCGYEVDDRTVFCPQCRFQFREGADGLVTTGAMVRDVPEHGEIIDESIFEERSRGFSAKELRQLKVQLVQTATLVVLIISLFVYTAISTVPLIHLTIAGLNFSMTGILSLAGGLMAGTVFFVISQRSLKKFRYR